MVGGGGSRTKAAVVVVAVDECFALAVVGFSVLAGLGFFAAGFDVRFSANGFLAIPVTAFAILDTSVDSFCFEGRLPTSVALRLLAIVRIGGLSGE